MNPNSSPEPHLDRYQSQSQLHNNKINRHQTLTNISSQSHPLSEKSTELQLNGTVTENIFNAGNAHLEIEAEDDAHLQKLPKPLNIKILTALASAVIMLPVLASGTITYYFGNQAINKQITLVRRVDPTGISETELSKQKQLLAFLLIGTGTTAVLVGLIAAFLANRHLRSAIEFHNAALKSQAEPKPNKLIRSLAKFIDYLNQSFDRDSILTATVQEAQRLLECDRVVIYRFDQSNYGKVIAESAVPGCIKAFGLNIQDSCFEADYQEKYRDGRVKILDDIDDVDLEPCYVQQLKKLDIKANLVTPIIHQEKLFGLLAAHQCSSSRAWQPEEIELLTRLAQRISFTLDSSKLLAESKRIKEQSATEPNWAECFADSVQHIRQSLQQQDILDVSVEEVHRVLGCDRVVVYGLNQDKHGVIIAESVTPGWTRALGTTIEDPCFEARYMEQYENGRVRALNNIYEADMMACYLDQLEKLSVKANLVTPIINDGQLFGLLVAHHCANPHNWQQQEITWVTQIAKQVGFALDNAKLIVEANQINQQQELETQWTEFFTDAVQHIRQSLQQKDVLAISVKEVRRVLNCDRVVIYSLDQDSYGTVVAESVAPGWTKALGITIEDPCFEARYLKQFENGRVRALDNIYEAGITACYLEQLEKLEVKANLVTPVINEGKLFGILVAHHCATPHNWQQHEIRWVTQIATQVGFALDNAKLLVESSQLKEQAAIETQWTEFFTDAVKHIRQSLQQQDILDVTVEEVSRILDCDRVVIYSLNQNNQGIVIAESVQPGWTRALGMTIKDPCFEARYIEKYQNGRVKALDNIYEAEITACYLEQLEKLEVKANLVTPIIKEEKLWGILVAHQCSSPRAWQQHEIRWITQITIQVGFALDNAQFLKQAEQGKLPFQPPHHFVKAKDLKIVTKENPPSEQASPSKSSDHHLKSRPTETPAEQKVSNRLLLDSKDAFEHLWLNTNQQSENIGQFLLHIQTMYNVIEKIMTNRQADLSNSAISKLDQATQAKINDISLRKNLAKVEDKMTQATQEIKQINYASQKIYQIGRLIDNFGKQMDQQATDFSIQANQQRESSRISLVSITEKVEPLTNRLTKQATQIVTLIDELSIEVREIIKGLDDNSQDKLAENSPAIQSSGVFNTKLPILSGKIAQTIEQTQNLAFVNQFILQIATRASQRIATMD